MDGDRFDRFSRAWAGSASRRALVRRLLGIAAGGAVLGRPGAASADHRDGHCMKVGKTCHRRKACCGGICHDGLCASCAGVVAWADAGLAAVDALTTTVQTARSVVGDVTSHGYDSALVGRVRDGDRAVADIAAGLRAITAPAVATNPLRELLEVLAAAADALSVYLEHVAEESYVETGSTADAALATVLADLPTIRDDIAELRTDCDGV